MHLTGTHRRRTVQKKERPTYIGHHRNLAAKQSRPHKTPTLETFSSIVHLIAKNTIEHAQILSKPLTNLDESTMSSLDPLVM
jgi:hypothetical protein